MEGFIFGWFVCWLDGWLAGWLLGCLVGSCDKCLFITHLSCVLKKQEASRHFEFFNVIRVIFLQKVRFMNILSTKINHPNMAKLCFIVWV